MRQHQDEDALVERRPAQDVVLAEAPVFVKAAFQVYEIAALAQAHLLGEPGQLIQVRRKISNSPNTGLRQIV